MVDDHPRFREAMVSFLEGEPDMTVVAETDDGETAIRLARELAPRIVLMDVVLPGMSGIEATRRIVSEDPERLVLTMSIQSHRKLVTQSRVAGAAGYVSKSTSGEEVLDTIRTVAAGGTVAGLNQAVSDRPA